VRVGIIGGGVAGLSAAVALSGSGHEVVVFESRSRHQPSPRAGHVHRMDAAAWALLDGLTRPDGPPTPRRRVPFGLARDGTLVWRGQQRLASLSQVEHGLTEVAERIGVHLAFGSSVASVAVGTGEWQLASTDGLRTSVDLLIDASGRHRALLGLLGERGPDVWLDEIPGPEWHMSLVGVMSTWQAQLLAWSHGQLEGLLQIDAGGQATLTVRSGSASQLRSDLIFAAMCHAGGPHMARCLDGITFSTGSSRYTSTGTSLIALDEADLRGWPPFVLIGDALIEALPRHGEGMGRAIEQALALKDAIGEGRRMDTLAVDLTQMARARWAGYGIARALVSDRPA